MIGLGIAVISDRVSPHYARNKIPYLVGTTVITGSPGPVGNAAAPSLASGSIDVFAEGRSIHRKYDSTGNVHLTNAVQAVDNRTGPFPANTLNGLGLGLVWRFHPQPFLIDGSSDVKVNGSSAGYHGARYVCSAVVEGRTTGIPTVFVSPSLGSIGSLATQGLNAVSGLIQTAKDHIEEKVVEPILERAQGE